MKWVGVILFFCFVSCDILTNNDDEKIVAKVYNYQLTEEQLRKIFPQEKDISLQNELINAYVQKWIKRKLMLTDAQKNISNELLKEIKEQTIAYEEDLIINYYTNQILEENNYYTPSEIEILNYYREYKEQLSTGEDLIQFHYIIYPESDAEIEKEFLQFSFKDDKKLSQLLDKTNLPTRISSEWVTLSNAATELPEIKEFALSPKKVFKKKMDGNILLIHVHDVTPKGEPPPYDYVKETIKTTLLNKRKLILLKDFEDKLFQHAKKADKIFIKSN